MKTFLVAFVFAALASINVVSACNGCKITNLKVDTLEGGEHMKVKAADKINITDECDVITSKRTGIIFPECLTFDSVEISCKYKDSVPFKTSAKSCDEYNSKVKNNPELEVPFQLCGIKDNFVCEKPCGNYTSPGKPYNLKDKESKMTAEGNGHHTCDVTFSFDKGQKIVKLRLEATIEGCKAKNLFGK